MDLNKAIEFGLLVNAAYAIAPNNLTNLAGQTLVAGTTTYNVVTSIYANDLATDMNPGRGNDLVSIGLLCQVEAGDVVIAIRGTEGILEWIHDAEFLLVPCPFLASAGHTDDGFTAMYNSLRTGTAAGSPSVVSAMGSLTFPKPVTSVTICGHSLGGALVTLLALDIAVNSSFTNPTVYSYASPRTGDPTFATKFNQIVTSSSRIANRLDLVPKMPFPPAYEHVNTHYDLNPAQLFPPKFLVKFTIPCEHALNSYLYLLSVVAGGAVIPLDSTCAP